MASIRAAAVLIAAALALAGCATRERLPLAPMQRAAITELRTHVAVAPHDAAGAGPAIGAPELQRAFDDALRRELPNYPIRLAAITTAVQALDAPGRAGLFGELRPAQALLLIEPRVQLSADARTVEADTLVSLWTRSGGERRPVQRAVLRYLSQPLGSGAADSLAQWTARDGAALRDALREAAAETIDMALLEFDLAVPSAITEPARVFAAPTDAPAGIVRGQLLKETADRSTVLGEDDRLYSLPKRLSATVNGPKAVATR